MTTPGRVWRRRLAIGVAVLGALMLAALVAIYAFMKFAVLPLRDGATLADGAVTTIVTGHFGPVAIGAYLFTLTDGGVGLIDAGSDRDARAIRAALAHAGNLAKLIRQLGLLPSMTIGSRPREGRSCHDTRLAALAVLERPLGHQTDQQLWTRCGRTWIAQQDGGNINFCAAGWICSHLRLRLIVHSDVILKKLATSGLLTD